MNITDIIKGRTVAIMAHGKSIEELEKRIEEFKPYNICWVGLNQFDMMDIYILSKIGKKLEIVMDCCSHPDNLIKNYNEKSRIPRLKEYLSRPDKNCWLTTYGILRDEMRPFPANIELFEKYGHKIDFVDNYFGDPHWLMEVPNSLTLLIGLLAIHSAKRIILFGVDGYSGEYKNNLESFYKPELQAKERLLAEGGELNTGIIGDTEHFKNRFIKYYITYCKKYNIDPIEIINCSPITIYEMFTKVNYDEVKEYL